MRHAGHQPVLALVLGLASVAAAGDDEIPFPVRMSTTASRDGATYVVEGRQRLESGVAVTCKQGIRIQGRGDDPVLEVAGSLVVEGQPHQEVVIEGVRIEAAEQFQGIRIEWARIRSGALATAEGGAVGKLSLESTSVDGPVRLVFRKGEIRLLNTEFRGAVELEGAAEEGAANLKIQILDCSGRDDELNFSAGFRGGLRIARAADVLVRGSWLADGRYEFEDCRALKFDGNTVIAKETCFRQSAAGSFTRTKIGKCDFYGGEVVFLAPKGAKPDRVVLDKCWFEGLAEDDDILQKAVRDGTRNEESGVRVLLRKVNKWPLGIGGTPVR